jgi:hypothetical protein
VKILLKTSILTCLTDEKFLPAKFGLAEEPFRLVVDRNPESVMAEPEMDQINRLIPIHRRITHLYAQAIDTENW